MGKFLGKSLKIHHVYNMEKSIMQKTINLLKNNLTNIAPKDWEQIIIYCEISDCSYEIMFYYSVTNNQKIQCYELEKNDISEEVIDQKQDDIYNLIYPFWQKDQKDHPWTNCTIIISKDNTFSIDYDNTNLDDGSYEYREQWEKKYLT